MEDDTPGVKPQKGRLTALPRVRLLCLASKALANLRENMKTFNFRRVTASLGILLGTLAVGTLGGVAGHWICRMLGLAIDLVR